MEEINAWGAYEAGTSLSARRLDNRSTRRRRPIRRLLQLTKKTNSSEFLEEADDSQEQVVSSSRRHTLFFGTDDIAALKEKKFSYGVDSPKEFPTIVEETTFVDANEAKEWREIRDLARRVFQVYFTNYDSDEDIARMKEKSQKKQQGLLKKINGTMPWLPAFLTGLSAPTFLKAPILFTEASFRGIAQVFFQNNPLSGLMILIAMFVQSSRVAVHGIIAIIVGNLTGLLMGFDKSFFSCGLFGYNSFLVGLAIATFDSSNLHTGYNMSAVIGVIIASYLSSVLFIMLGKLLAPYKTPPFTLPFNISTLTFLMAMKQITKSVVDDDPLVSVVTTPMTARAFFAASIRGIGQVFLADNIISGVLVLAGIMFCSRISAVAAFVGSLLGAGVAALVGEDVAAIENGLFGFNPSLTLTAMVMFYVPSLGSLSFGIVASVVTVFVQLALEVTFRIYGLPSMTLPFCLAALAFIMIQGTTPNVISVPLSSMTTPEDHLKRVRRLSDGFNLLFGSIRSASYQGRIRKSWKSLVGYNKGSSMRMSSVLQEYDEETHGGETEGGFVKTFDCCKELFGCKRHGSIRESIIQRINKSFRLSATLTSGVMREEKEAYSRMFNLIDKTNAREISKNQFEEFLRTVGFDDPIGLDFASQAFQLMDLDDSGDIDSDEFIAFARISCIMPGIRRLIVDFFDFVDVNGDKTVEIAELDSSRLYLGLPPISDDDRNCLNALCNEDDELEFDTIVNFVTIFKLKSIVKEYQATRKQGMNQEDL